jgi:hypothetical protein
MWEIIEPPVAKLIIGILAADDNCRLAAIDALSAEFGEIDFVSDVFAFDGTSYYLAEAGPAIIKQFVTFAELIDPIVLAEIKHRTNEMEQRLAEELGVGLPRPVNLDPGYMEPSKLVLASTKNFSHRIYIGQSMYAELTLSFCKGKWQSYPYTFPDYKKAEYHLFFDTVRTHLVERLK